nr:hypothetical protein [Bacteroidaceae bacterium]
MIALVNGQFYGAKHDSDDGQPAWGLVIDGHRIVDLCPVDKIDKRIQRIDMEGCSVVPGFIDLLANGAGGGAFGVTAHYDDLVQMSTT